MANIQTKAQISPDAKEIFFDHYNKLHLIAALSRNDTLAVIRLTKL